MKVQRLDHSLVADSLVDLILEQYRERQQLGTDLHTKKVYLLKILRKTEEAEILLSKGLLDKRFLEEQKNLVHDCITELQQIRTAIYSPLIDLSGLVIALKSHISNLDHTQGSSIDLNYLEKDKPKLDTLNSYPIFKSCVSLLNLVANRKAKKTEITLSLNKTSLLIKILTDKKLTKSFTKKYLYQINKAKAQLLLAGGTIERSTNWIDSFSFSFRLKASKV